jgi:hypothetical protein
MHGTGGSLRLWYCFCKNSNALPECESNGRIRAHKVHDLVTATAQAVGQPEAVLLKRMIRAFFLAELVRFHWRDRQNEWFGLTESPSAEAAHV